MPIYRKATAEAKEICGRMMERYHGGLQSNGVTVDLLFAFPSIDQNGDSTGPALKLHGYRCAAVVKINAYKLRVQGHADAEITIDGERWDTWSAEEKDALIDHELEHLELKFDKYGGIVRDDLNRPKLKIRLHDHQFGWFDSIARRHGDASGEQQQAREFFNGPYEQRWLPFTESPDTSNSQASSSQSLNQEIEKAVAEAGVPVVSLPLRKRGGMAGKPKSRGCSRKAASSR